MTRNAPRWVVMVIAPLVLGSACRDVPDQELFEGTWYGAENAYDELEFGPDGTLTVRYLDPTGRFRANERTATYTVVDREHIRVTDSLTDAVTRMTAIDGRLTLSSEGDSSVWRRGDKRFLIARDTLFAAAARAYSPGLGFQGFEEGPQALRDRLAAMEAGGARYRLLEYHPRGLIFTFEIRHDAVPGYSCVARELAVDGNSAELFLSRYYERLHGRPPPATLVPWTGEGERLHHQAELEMSLGFGVTTLAEGRPANGDSIVCDLIGEIQGDRIFEFYLGGV